MFNDMLIKKLAMILFRYIQYIVNISRIRAWKFEHNSNITKKNEWNLNWITEQDWQHYYMPDYPVVAPQPPLIPPVQHSATKQATPLPLPLTQQIHSQQRSQQSPAESWTLLSVWSHKVFRLPMRNHSSVPLRKTTWESQVKKRVDTTASSVGLEKHSAGDFLEEYNSAINWP